MRSSIFKVLVLITLAVPFTGCPPSAHQALLGFWLVDLNAVDDNIGLTVLPAGEATSPNPPPAPAAEYFAGTLAWSQQGSTFTLSQMFDSKAWVFTGTVSSPTSIAGTWEQTEPLIATGSGSWTATWVRDVP